MHAWNDHTELPQTIFEVLHREESPHRSGARNVSWECVASEPDVAVCTVRGAQVTGNWWLLKPISDADIWCKVWFCATKSSRSTKRQCSLSVALLTALSCEIGSTGLCRWVMPQVSWMSYSDAVFEQTVDCATVFSLLPSMNMSKLWSWSTPETCLAREKQSSLATGASIGYAVQAQGSSTTRTISFTMYKWTTAQQALSSAQKLLPKVHLLRQSSNVLQGVCKHVIFWGIFCARVAQLRWCFLTSNQTYGVLSILCYIMCGFVFLECVNYGLRYRLITAQPPLDRCTTIA